MKLIGFRTPKPRKFSYKPLFYDPVKEEKESMLKYQSGGESMHGVDLRMRMRLRMNRKKLDEQVRKRSRMTGILFTVLLLLLILYFIFF